MTQMVAHALYNWPSMSENSSAFISHGLAVIIEMHATEFTCKSNCWTFVSHAIRTFDSLALVDQSCWL